MNGEGSERGQGAGAELPNNRALGISIKPLK